jgi:hypothetical protein
MWRSQTFENTYQGGYLLVVPFELLAEWHGKGGAYDEICERSPRSVDVLPIGDGFGVFVAGPDGDIAHEAWWLRDGDAAPLMLAAWNEWGTADRDAWLTAQLGREDLVWGRHDERLRLASGVLVLVHGEDAGSAALLAPANRTAVCGEGLVVGLAPGIYRLETAEIEERPDGEHCVVLCRLVRDLET